MGRSRRRRANSALTVVPGVSVNPTEQVVMALNRESTALEVQLKSHAPMQAGALRLNMPSGWSSQPEIVHFELENRHEEKYLLSN